MVNTKNIKLCAFLKLNGVNPIEVIKITRGKAEYVYSMDEKEFDRWQIAFTQSHFMDYANHLESIKDLAY